MAAAGWTIDYAYREALKGTNQLEIINLKKKNNAGLSQPDPIGHKCARDVVSPSAEAHLDRLNHPSCNVPQIRHSRMDKGLEKLCGLPFSSINALLSSVNRLGNFCPRAVESEESLEGVDWPTYLLGTVFPFERTLC